MRADGGGAAAFAERAGLLFRIAAQLKRIADQYQLAVVTVNQMSDVMTGPDGAAIAPVSFSTTIPANCWLSSYSLEKRRRCLSRHPAESLVVDCKKRHNVRLQPIHTGGLRLVTSGREVQPALGLAWANCVNHRVFLSREAHPFVLADPPESSQLQTQVTECVPVVELQWVTGSV